MNKPLLKSMTVWGVILLAVVNAVAGAGLETGLLTEGPAEIIKTVGFSLGTLLTGLGARRAIKS